MNFALKKQYKLHLYLYSGSSAFIYDSNLTATFENISNCILFDNQGF